jgi:hypothetical protein
MTGPDGDDASFGQIPEPNTQHRQQAERKLMTLKEKRLRRLLGHDPTVPNACVSSYPQRQPPVGHLQGGYPTALRFASK